MNRTADLDAALKFVIYRIEEQANQSGDPLSDAQRMLLNYMPSSMPGVYWDPETTLAPRNLNYERLCALGKAAFLADHKGNPKQLDWQFAFAVLQLNNHPTWGLLQQAGVKCRRPLWDRFLLSGAALLFVMAMLSLMFLARSEPSNVSEWARICSGLAILLLLAYFASRRLEKWQLEEHIERCRLASRFANTSGNSSS